MREITPGDQASEPEEYVVAVGLDYGSDLPLCP